MRFPEPGRCECRKPRPDTVRRRDCQIGFFPMHTLHRGDRPAWQPVLVDTGRGLGHAADATAAAVPHQPGDPGVRTPADPRRDVALVAQIVDRPPPPTRTP